MTRWPWALAACALLAVALLLPRLGGAGLWEPQERQVADRAAPPAAAAKPASNDAKDDKARPRPGDKPAAPPAKPGGPDSCLHAPPPDAAARTLTGRAIKWGRDAISDGDAGRRLPLAVLGLVTVLAAAGTAMRLAGARAGVVAAVVLVAMPLLTLQARMLTSEIGTACGASLIIYGLIALGPHAPRWRAAPGALGRPAIDVAVAVIAVAAGVAIGFYAGGALLGLVVPIGAVAAAGSLGVPVVGAIRRREPVARWLVPVIATLATVGLIWLLARQLYDLKTPFPGMTPPPARELFGKAILPTGCYSWALGATWRPDDDLRMIFDSSFEQIAYGTFPWGLVAPIAMAGLLAAPDPRRRLLGAVTLAWAGGAWVAGEAFQRKVGFTIYAGFPGLAIAVGAWLDGMFAGRARGEPDAVPPGAKLIALFAVLATLDVGKDQQSFAERLSSLLVGGDAISYPTQSRFLWLPTKLWVLLLGVVTAIGFAAALLAWRPGEAPQGRGWRRLATAGAIAAIAATLGLAVFWAAIWQPRLALNLSSKSIFETYQALAKPGDDLIVMGDLGQTPLAYTGTAPQTAPDRSQIIAALGRPNRVFAVAPQSELCTLHREIAGKPYFVIEDRNVRNLLLSNQVDGAVDKNPLREAIVHGEPPVIPYRPKSRVVWDGKIQLLGWDMPKTAARGQKFEITLYYKILQPVGGAWKTLMHFDGPAGRAGNGDHDPIGGRCPTSTWTVGDYIIDRFSASAGGGAFPSGVHQVWLGFFTGTNPNWKNMPVSEAPSEMRDTADRVRITTIGLD